ncbi:MAG: AAA family ATPase [Alphaproteobacteria bacterium]|nr:AAA family ATPase [Alphaproteobacteria bacterium]
MAESAPTKHLVFDLKTGFSYGLKMNAQGECLDAQPLNTIITTDDGRVIRQFGPDNDDGLGPFSAPPQLPYGETTIAVELTDDNKPGKVFSIAWPKETEASKGALPQVTQKEMPADLVKLGFAAMPKGASTKGKGVEDEKELNVALENINRMVGLDNAKKEIRQNISIARFNAAKQKMGIKAQPLSRHMVFTGNPGTGKTTFAREVAKAYYALGFIDKPEVHEVKRENLVAGFVGQTALKTTEKIEKAKGGILFIDEAYSLSRDTGADSKDFGREAIDTLVAAMENMRDDLVVIVAGYTEPMKKFIAANEGLKSRFNTYIEFDDYPMDQLSKIMDSMMEDRGYKISQEAKDLAVRKIDEQRAKDGKNFGNGRTVRNLVEMAEKNMAERLDAQGILGKTHGLSKKALKNELTTITLEDITPIKLDNLTQKNGLSGQFGDALNKAGDASNNNTPPAAPPAPITAKQRFTP